MKKIALLTMAIILSGCTPSLSWIPSKWDPNEAAVITDVQFSAVNLDCKENYKQSIDHLYSKVKWIETYSKFKGTRDISEIIIELVNTTTEFKSRSDNGGMSKIYCEMKRKVIIQESEMTAKTIQGRF